MPQGNGPKLFFQILQFKRHNVHDYDTRNKDKLVITVISGRLPAGNVFTQAVVGAGYRKVRLM